MLAANRFVVIDTETTGLDPEFHRVVEVAAVLVVGGKITAAWTSYINPLRDIPAVTSAVHGLVNEDVIDAPTLTEALPRLNAFIAEADVLVAHNAPFDLSMLPGLATKPWLDTLRLSQHLYPDLESHKNGALRYELGLKCPEAAGMPAHRALSDAYVTARLLIHLLTETSRRAEYPVYHDQLIRHVSGPLLLPTCRFGKHRGSSWKEVPSDYLNWVIKQDMDLDVIFTARYWLAQA